MHAKHSFGTRIKRNLLILLVAFLTAIALFYVIKNPEIFQASVLTIQEQARIQAEQWDVAYKTENKVLDIFLAPHIKKIKKIDFTINYDSTKVLLVLTGATGQIQSTSLSQTTDALAIQAFPSSLLDYEQSFFLLPFEADEPQILLGETIAYYEDGSQQSLAVGNLNAVKETHP